MLRNNHSIDYSYNVFFKLQSDTKHFRQHALPLSGVHYKIKMPEKQKLIKF